MVYGYMSWMPKEKKLNRLYYLGVMLKCEKATKQKRKIIASELEAQN